MCRGSALELAAFSTRVTMSVSAALARQARPTFSPSRTIEAVEEFDLGAPALVHVLAHRGALPGGGAAAILEALLVAGAHRRLVALAGARDRLGRQMQDLLELIAVRLADADRFAAEPGREAADRIVLAASRRRRGRCRRRARSAWRWRRASTSARPTDCRSPWRCRHSRPGGRLLPPAGVMRPCTSPARNTVCAAPRLAAPRWIWPGSGRLTVML